ncbi:MAG: hypothetical protein Q7R70_00425 [Candidatus Diapherotrites archaeon]|nr:hypothetical protein [Candidatus Diapherotrites archaeon]
MDFKQFSMMAVIALMISGLALAQTIKAPSLVEITPENKEFTVKVTNDSNKPGTISILFSSPMDYDIQPTPVSIQAFTTQSFKIKLSPDNSQSNQSFEGTIIATIGDSASKKSIEVSISGDFSKKQGQSGSTGFFALPSLGNLSWDQILDILLVIIIVILAIALFARLVNRGKKQGEF